MAFNFVYHLNIFIFFENNFFCYFLNNIRKHAYLNVFTSTEVNKITEFTPNENTYIYEIPYYIKEILKIHQYIKFKMEDKDKINKILNLVGDLSKNYFKENIDNDITDLKERLRDFVTNPLFSDDSIYEIRTFMSELDKVDDYLWNSIEDVIAKNYSKYVRKESFNFEGKMRDHEKQLVGIIKEFGVGKNQTPTMSTIISYLLLHEESGLTQQQLKELTGFSMGSISSNLKIMERALVKTLIKGTRTYKYSLSIPGGSFAQLAFKAGEIKKESNEQAINFIKDKIALLNDGKYVGKLGQKMLVNRLNDLKSYILVRKDILDRISQDKLIDKIVKKLD